MYSDTFVIVNMSRTQFSDQWIFDWCLALLACLGQVAVANENLFSTD